MKFKFSIIVPVYNSEQYLEMCVESVLRQTYPFFEIVMVDDGSTDASAEICDRYANTFQHRIHVAHTPNQGALRARETGVKISGGNILIFLDSDDELRSDALQTIANCFEVHQCDVVLFNASDDPDFVRPAVSVPYEDGAVFSGEARRQILKDLVASKIPNSLCLKAVKRDSYAFVPDRLEYTSVKHGEDLLASIFIMEKAESVAICGKQIYFYRKRQGSISHVYNPLFIDSVRVVHGLISQKIGCWGIPECCEINNRRIVKAFLYAVRDVCCLPRQKRHAQLIGLSCDPLFCGAYENMDNYGQNNRDRLLGRLLYGKQYFLISCFCLMERIIQNARNRIRIVFGGIKWF